MLNRVYPVSVKELLTQFPNTFSHLVRNPTLWAQKSLRDPLESTNAKVSFKLGMWKKKKQLNILITKFWFPHSPSPSFHKSWRNWAAARNSSLAVLKKRMRKSRNFALNAYSHRFSLWVKKQLLNAINLNSSLALWILL